MYERIVVPLDGSELAERALPTAEELARLTGAPLHIVRVVDLTRLEPYAAYGLAPEFGAMATVLGDEDTAAREYLAATERALTERGVKVTSELRTGTAAREIIALARPQDLVVMASHGRGGVARWFLGSVAEEVARQAPAPVLLVRAVAAAAEAPPSTEEPVVTATR